MWSKIQVITAIPTLWPLCALYFALIEVGMNEWIYSQVDLILFYLPLVQTSYVLLILLLGYLKFKCWNTSILTHVSIGFAYIM